MTDRDEKLIRHMTMYETEDGEIAWDRMNDTLGDVSGGYLRQIEGVESKNARSPEGLLRQLAGGDASDLDDDELARRLQKGIQKMSTLISSRVTLQKDDEFVLYRIAKFAPAVSKLSDQYAMEDSMYQSQWHDDVVEICDVLVAHNRDQNA